MGDSYDKVQERRVLTDSLTRLDMSLEAMVFLRAARRGKETEGKGYLIYCEPEEADNEDVSANVEWEGRINAIKKTLKQTDQKMQLLADKIDATNVTAGQKIGATEQILSAAMEQKMVTMGQKMEAMEQKIELKMQAMSQKMETSMNTMSQKFLDIAKQTKA